jgi:Sulfotransferase family
MESTTATAADCAGPVAAGPDMRVPDFFIVGHEKCGTTALDLMLKRHPQIFMPDVKEQRYFAPDLRGGDGHKQRPDTKRPYTFDRYLAVFAAASSDQHIGEASPQYLKSRVAASRIASVQPDARIIAIFREPASFLRSVHLQMVQNNIETQRDFRKAVALEQARRHGSRIPRRCKLPQALLYSEHVRYVEQLRRYYAVFPPEQILVLIYDDFRRDNEGTVRRVLRFLEVDDAFSIEKVETKPLKAVRSFYLKHLAESARIARRNPAVATPLGRAVNALTPKQLRSDTFRAKWRNIVYTAPSPPDEEFMLELRRRFKPEVQSLSECMGRDLVSLWGYGDVA